MSEELLVCKNCSHLKGNHIPYEGDNKCKCIKCDCTQFIE